MNKKIVIFGVNAFSKMIKRYLEEEKKMVAAFTVEEKYLTDSIALYTGGGYRDCLF